MTAEGDQTGKLIRESKKGPLGFDTDDRTIQPDQTIKKEVVVGRRTKVKVGEVKKRIVPMTTFVEGKNVEVFLRGGLDAPIHIDDLKLLVNARQNKDAQKALRNNRKDRKENLQAGSGQLKP
jgi:hypothetical protein